MCCIYDELYAIVYVVISNNLKMKILSANSLPPNRIFFDGGKYSQIIYKTSTIPMLVFRTLYLLFEWFIKDSISTNEHVVVLFELVGKIKYLYTLMFQFQ